MKINSNLTKKITITLEEWEWAMLLFQMAKGIKETDNETQTAFKDFVTQHMKKSSLRAQFEKELANGKH